MILRDRNAVTGIYCQGYESVVVDSYGSGVVSDTRLLSLCVANQLSILGFWFKQNNIYRHTWICNDGHTRKELEHIITNNRSFFRSVWVCPGAKAAANTDHRVWWQRLLSTHLSKLNVHWHPDCTQLN